MATYIALIHQAGRRYRVSFPDRPDCSALASSLDEAIALAREQLANSIKRALSAGEEVAAPAALDTIDRRGANLVVAIDVPDDLVVEPIELAVPALSLMRFDAFAKRRRLTRSALFVEAVDRWIDQEPACNATEATSSLAPSGGDEPAVDIESIRRELNAPNQNELIPNDERVEALHDDCRDPESIKADMIRLLENQSEAGASEGD
jgi:predicted RNase H-like HicB family nuclease